MGWLGVVVGRLVTGWVLGGIGERLNVVRLWLWVVGWVVKDVNFYKNNLVIILKNEHRLIVFWLYYIMILLLFITL